MSRKKDYFRVSIDVHYWGEFELWECAEARIHVGDNSKTEAIIKEIETNHIIVT